MLPAEIIAEYGVVPIVTLDRVADALPLADALLGGGLPVLEITFRTAAAAEAIGILRQRRPEMLVGAGTILTRDNLRAAVESGAQFALAPGLNPEIVTRAQELGLLFLPGVATPTEIERALALGCRLVKIFPAEPLGGVALVRALAGPYRQTGVRFVATGGIAEASVTEYLREPSIAAVGGSWLASAADLAQGDFAAIETRCRAAMERFRAARIQASPH